MTLTRAFKAVEMRKKFMVLSASLDRLLKLKGNNLRVHMSPMSLLMGYPSTQKKAPNCGSMLLSATSLMKRNCHLVPRSVLI